MSLTEFKSKLKQSDREKFETSYNIVDSKFSNEALSSMLINCLKTDQVSNIINCDITIFPNCSFILENSTLENCKIFGTPCNIRDSKLKDVEVKHCSAFICKDIELEDALFTNGAKFLKCSNPIIFNFEKGSILNISPGNIDFFGYVGSFKFFLDNINNYPYNEYKSELTCIILSGVRD